MKKLKCFLCGARYNPEKRETVALLYDLEQDTVFPVRYIQMNKKRLRLCHMCARAVSLGVALQSGYTWDEELQYEEDEDKDEQVQ